MLRTKLVFYVVRTKKVAKMTRKKILRILAFEYAVQHPIIFNIAEKFVSTESNNERRIVSYERKFKKML